MNILYVGPYRQNNDDGILSKLYLQNLIIAKHNITCRPIYLSQSNIERFNGSFLKYETKIYEEYDCLIQHAPLELLQKHETFPKNIAIPILGDIINLKSYHQKQLMQFDKIIINNDNNEAVMVKNDLAEKAYRIACPIMDSLVEDLKEKKLNLGIHNSTTKFYFFGNLDRDMDVIQKILVSFYIAFRSEYGKSLVLFLEDVNQAKQSEFMNMTKEIKQKLKITISDKSVSEFFIFKNLLLEEKIIAHNSCQVFLNLGQKSSLQEQYAKFFGNHVINTDEVETIEVPNHNSSQYEPNDTYESIITQSLIDVMKNSLDKPKEASNSFTHTPNSISSAL
jgi:hypothetical protein